jgi:hypothetical protein
MRLPLPPVNDWMPNSGEFGYRMPAGSMMAVRCSKCGEELLGAVNRCWKCGQTFALHPEIDGRPPVRAEAPADTGQPLEAIVIDEAAQTSGAMAPLTADMPKPAAPVIPVAAPRYTLPRRATTAELVDARRAGMMAMGGTVASLVLGIFSLVLAVRWPPAAMIAVLGLAMGIWGLRSPRRNWALVGMLLCCLAIGLGAYGVARATYVYIQSQRAPVIEDTADPQIEP